MKHNPEALLSLPHSWLPYPFMCHSTDIYIKNKMTWYSAYGSMQAYDVIFQVDRLKAYRQRGRSALEPGSGHCAQTTVSAAAAYLSQGTTATAKDLPFLKHRKSPRARGSSTAKRCTQQGADSVLKEWGEVQPAECCWKGIWEPVLHLQNKLAARSTVYIH